MASTKPSTRRGWKPSSHQRPSTSTRVPGTVDPRLDATDEAVRKRIGSTYQPSVVSPAERRLPDVVEAEQGAEQAAIPDERVEGREERDGGHRLDGRLEQLDLVAEDEAPPRTPSASTGTSSPSWTSSSRRAVRPG